MSTILGTKCATISATSTPSAKSRVRLRFGRDRGIWSIQVYSLCNSSSSICVLVCKEGRKKTKTKLPILLCPNLPTCALPMSDERFDGILLSLAQQLTGGIDQLLEVFFSFLYRKTDFFTGESEQQAKQALLKKFNEFMEKARKDKKAAEPEPLPAPGITEIAEEPAAPPAAASAAAAAAAPTAAPAAAAASAASSDSAAKKQPKSSPGTLDKLSEVDSGDEDTPNTEGKLRPNYLNGATLENYVWGQTLKDVEIRIPMTRSLPPGTKIKTRDINIDFTATTIKCGLKNQPPILQGKLEDRIQPDESTWLLEDGNTVVFHLEKVNQMSWWSAVVEGEPRINTRKVQPENSKLSDLDDDETKQMVEKMMINQRRKEAGMPSLEEQQKLDVLEKFKKAHPEMDFSNAKIQ
eukprot:m.48950 g.48950  ORF g.48950 m.48950 type:complete len:408 (-) comp14996_c0_seq2:20-1243(-)